MKIFQAGKLRRGAMKSIVSSFLVAILIFTVGALAILNAQKVSDLVKANGFQPSQKMAAIEQKIQIKDDAKTVFYATHPELQSADEFNKNCVNETEDSSILGCYKDDRIFVYDVENSELDGVEEVTTAHEFSHAIWARMSQSERDDLSQKLMAQYDQLNDEKLKNRMALYEKTEPGEMTNELHSILGTEQVELSADLEAHYAKYFKDRKSIAQMARNYKSKFEQLEARANELSAELKNLKTEVETKTSDYNAKSELLNSDIEAFNNLAATEGGFSSQAEFSRQRQALISRQDFLQSYRSEINQKVDLFNQKQQELAKIATKSNDLQQSINSKLAAPPSV